MKEKIIKWTLRITPLVIIFCLPVLAHAQACDPDDPACVPIDGGVSFLIAAGVGYGIKKIRDNKNYKKRLL